MCINLKISEKQLGKEVLLHYLPANINGNGEANIKEYFNNYTAEEDGHLTNALRGYPLDGVKFKMPAGLRGAVLQETNCALNESTVRILKVTGTFDEFVYWNYDKVPSLADTLPQAMQVFCIGDELSKEISAEDMVNEAPKDPKSECKLALIK